MPARKQDNQGPTAKWLIEQIDKFLTVNPVLENDGCVLGYHIGKDRSLIERLRNGGDVFTSRMDEIIAFLTRHDNVIVTRSEGGSEKNVTLTPITIPPRSTHHD